MKYLLATLRGIRELQTTGRANIIAEGLSRGILLPGWESARWKGQGRGGEEEKEENEDGDLRENGRSARSGRFRGPFASRFEQRVNPGSPGNLGKRGWAGFPETDDRARRIFFFYGERDENGVPRARSRELRESFRRAFRPFPRELRVTARTHEGRMTDNSRK